MSHDVQSLLETARETLEEGGRVAACLVSRARGSTPQSAGALMLVDDDARLHGTVGGGCVEAEVRRTAHRMLSEGRSGLLRYTLDHDYGWDDGLICGGTVEIAVAPLTDADELARVIDDLGARRPTMLSLQVATDDGPRVLELDLPPRDRLYIAGAGHVGQALARLAMPLEFEVTLFDDRDDLLHRFAPDGARRVGGEIAASLRSAPIDDRTWCVVVTRGHRHDEQALEAVAERGAAYVGMIGSRRKVKLIVDDLRARGVDPGALDAVHAPIGLDIGSVTVEEIALSIAAQLVQVRRRERRTPVSSNGAVGDRLVGPRRGSESSA